MRFVFVYVPKPRFVIAGSPVAGCGPYGFHMRAVQPPTAGSSVANCKTRKRNRYSDIMYEALRYYI